MNFYTLKNQMTGERSYLNGKIFTVKKEKDSGKAIFYILDDKIWITSTVTSIEYTSDGVNIVTHNSKYELINVENLLPTKKGEESTNDTLSEDTEEPKMPVVLNTRSVNRGISYGDGYHGAVTDFASEVSYDDFLKYLKQEEYDLRRLEGAAWYEDHAAILRGSIKSGDRVGRYTYAKSTDKPCTTWTYLWIRAYTD